MHIYQDIDGYAKRSVLPQPLQRDLKVLAQRRLSNVLVDRIVMQLAFLPPECVSTVEVEVRKRAYLASVWGPKGDSLLDQVFGSTDKNRLRAYPGLEHVFMFHGSGYIREAALHRITEPATSPFQICAVAWRINDWVANVRAAASACFFRTVDQSDATVLAQAAVILIPKVCFWGRLDADMNIRKTLLQREDVLAVLLDHLTKAVTGTPHKVLVRLGEDRRLDALYPRLLQHARHPAVRALAAGVLLRKKAETPGDLRKQWISKAEGRFRMVYETVSRDLEETPPADLILQQVAFDRSVLVRKVAMQAIIDDPSLWTQRKPFIEHLSRDRSPAIRAGINYILRQQTKEALDPRAS